MRRMPLRLGLWIGLVPILLMGCSDAFVMARGPNGDVTLFSDFGVGDERRDVMRAYLTRSIWSPVRPESAFRVDTADSTQFSARRDWRNLVLLGDLGSQSWSARQCRAILGEEAARALATLPAGYRLARDTWADGQTVLFVHASSIAALRDLFAEYGDRLQDQLDELIIAGLVKTIYAATSEQRRMEEGIRQRHGYTLRIPKEYFVEEQTENRFVRLKNMLPDGAMTYLFIYYQEQQADTLDPRFCMAIRDTLAAYYCAGDRVEPTRTRVRRREFAGHDALEIHGLYQNLDPPMGGPFKSICFHDGGRFYMIDLAAFNPPGKKQPLMRMLEAIALTFRAAPSG